MSNKQAFLFIALSLTLCIALSTEALLEARNSLSGSFLEDGHWLFGSKRPNLIRKLRQTEETNNSTNLGTNISEKKRQNLSSEEANLSNKETRSKRRLFPIHLTAIHIGRAEFPLSKLLFELTLRMALNSMSEQLELEQRVQLVLSIRDANTCSHQFAGAIAAEEYYRKRARLFIVSGCDDAIRGVSLLASKWQVPIMTAAGFGADLNDKSVHKTLIRVAFSLHTAVEFLFKLLKLFQWHRVNLIVDESDQNSLALRGSIEEHSLIHNSAHLSASNATNQGTINLNTISLDFGSLMMSSDLNATLKFNTNISTDSWPNERMQSIIGNTLSECSMFSRVNILLIPQQYLRRFMLSVYDQNMANGLYTFINIPLILEAGQDSVVVSKQAIGSTTAKIGDNSAFLWRASRSLRNSQAKQAFESLMSIYLRAPSTKAYVYFASHLTNLVNANFGQLEGASKSLRQQLEINPYLASFYDSLHIYTMALNESLVALKSRRHQRAKLQQQNLHAQISELVRNRRYDDMVTGHIYINQNGDRETDYTLDDMNQMTGKFAPVILYRGETRSIERTGRIHWSSDATVGPTSDTVDCNLSSTCASKPISRFVFIICIMIGPLVLIICSLAYFVFSRLSMESRLVDYWWRIHMSEIDVVLTRRKKANDGSIVMTSIATGDGVDANYESSVAQLAGTNSFSSLAGRQNTKFNATQGTESCTTGGGGSASGGGAGPTMLIGSGNRFKTNTVVTSQSKCKSDITKDTKTSVGQWSQTLSVNDVCFGNITLGIYKQTKVALKPMLKFHQTRKLMEELRSIKDINHTNLCRFVGIIIDEGSTGIVSEFCPKGSLREFFHNESIVIDWTFKYSIINDILAGLNYLHSSSLGYHGRLKSSNCLVDARFVVKLSDYGPHSLYERFHLDSVSKISSSFKKNDDEFVTSNNHGGGEDYNNDKKSTRSVDEETLLLKKLIWLAPEHLGSSPKAIGSMKGDIYSFGLLLYEIITNNLPFYDVEKNDFVMPLKTLYQELKNHGPNEATGPNISDIDSEQNIDSLIELMKLCWQYDPTNRPTLQMVNASLRKITRGVTSKKLLENLTDRMEQYTNNLESLVEAKLATLLEEKLKTEELLYQFVPKSIAALLKKGQFVDPEAFGCVTVFYSDIVGFTSLSSESSPMEVVGFLSDLYLCFDETLEQHDIFKVDTIGDAYIVASGLPKRNDGKHVVEIACAALELRDRLRCFKIPHKPGRSLEMRVGIHSGPCIAGIVGGLNMPKYCVFGDTLTTGKFMETTGLPMKIHITQESKDLLEGFDGFTIEQRQPRITRDGLPFQTYWLERK